MKGMRDFEMSMLLTDLSLHGNALSTGVFIAPLYIYSSIEP
jgi:hypothetical protein